MTRYLFDSTAVVEEMTQIVEWLRSLGIDPAIVPTGAELVHDVAAGVLTIEVHRLNEHGRKFVGPDGEVARSWVSVELDSLLPDFASLGECPA